MKLEVLCSVREGSTDPGFKARMIVGHVSATREPRAIEPLQRAKFEIEPPAYLDLRHDHRREPEPANFALRGESLCLDCDVVSAVFQRRDLGIVPLIAKPLSVCESLAFGPRDQALGGLEHAFALVWPGNADVCHAACRQVADFHAELVGIVPGRQTIQRGRWVACSTVASARRHGPRATL